MTVESDPRAIDGATLLHAITNSDPAVMDELLANHDWTRLPGKTAGSPWPTHQRPPQDDTASTSRSIPQSP